MSWLDLLKADNLKLYWDNSKASEEIYIGEAFFPNERQQGLEFSFIRGKDDAPVALVSANFDTNVLYRDRMGVEELRGTLPFFKEALKVDEKLRQKLITTDPKFAQMLYDQIFNDNMRLLKSARVTAERMRMQLLSTGTITIQENGVDKQYDYGFAKSSQYKTLTKLWDAEGAKPLKDISEQLNAYKKLTGRAGKYIIMNDAFFSEKVAGSAEVIDYFAKLPTPNLYPTDEEVKLALERKFGVTIVLVSGAYKKARDFNGKTEPFYPAGTFTIVSTLDLGKTLFGTTPEEIDLLGGVSKASSVVVTEEGIAITTWNEVDPVNVNTKVSEVVLPTCPNIDQIYIVKAVS